MSSVCVFNPCVGLTRETCGKAEKRTVLIRSRRDSLAGPHNKNWEESLENEDLQYCSVLADKGGVVAPSPLLDFAATQT